MPQAIPAVIGLAGSVIGGKKAKKAADADRASQNAIIDRLSKVKFDPQSVFGGSGMGFDFDTMTGDLGDFAPFQEMFGGLADSSFGQGMDIQQGAIDAGMPALMDLFGGSAGLAQQSLGDIGNVNTDFLQNQFGGGMDFVSSMFGDATAEGKGIRDLAQAFAQQGVGDAMGQSQNFLNRSDFFGDEAQVGFEDLRADTLNLLRERDKEGEDRAAAGLADELFGSGRLGTTGGGRNISDFAQGLARADLDRQLAATGEARAARESSGNLAQAFGGLSNQAFSLAPAMMNAGTSAMNAGTGVSGLEQIPLNAFSNFGQNFGMAQELEDTMLNSAFNRFGSTSGLVQDLFGGMFNTGSTMIGQGGSALQSMLGLETMPLEFGEFAANLAATAANTDIAAAGGQGQIASNFGPSGNDLLASGLSQFGSNMFQSGGGFDAITGGIKGLFKKKTPTPEGKAP